MAHCHTNRFVRNSRKAHAMTTESTEMTLTPTAPETAPATAVGYEGVRHGNRSVHRS